MPRVAAWRARVPGPPAVACALLLALGMLAVVGWGLGAVSRAYTTHLDLLAVQGLAGERTQVLTLGAHAFSWMGKVAVVIACAAAAATILVRSGRLVDALTVALGSVGASALLFLDKLVVARPRPPVEHLEAAASTSFPSGHATLSAALCTSLVFAVTTGKRRPVAMFVVAACALLIACVALSRVYLGVHYPSDVAAGILLGGMWVVVLRVSLRLSGAARGLHAKASVQTQPLRRK